MDLGETNKKRLTTPQAILIVISILAIIWISIQSDSETDNRIKFYKQSFSTTVIKVSLIDGRVNRFYLKTGLSINLSPHSYGKIIIGDSIKKQANTYLY